MSREKLKPINQSNENIFNVTNFPGINTLPSMPISESLPDDDFDVAIMSHEEKKTFKSNITIKRENVLLGKSKVISLFKEASDFKLKNLNDFRSLAEQAAVMARLNAAACAPGDGHGAQSSSSQISLGGESALSIGKSNGLPGAKHESGKHDHCSHGNDYGECPNGCKKAA